MRTAVALALVAALGIVIVATSLAVDTDKGRSRPPGQVTLHGKPLRLNADGKALWMSEWAACRHQSRHQSAAEIGVKIPSGRSPQSAAKAIAAKAEAFLWNIESETVTAVDGCRNGILWRYYHE